MTKKQQNEVKQQIANELGFQKSRITLLECGGKSFYSNKYEYVMFEVFGISYQYKWNFLDNVAELYHFNQETLATTKLN